MRKRGIKAQTLRDAKTKDDEASTEWAMKMPNRYELPPKRFTKEEKARLGKGEKVPCYINEAVKRVRNYKVTEERLINFREILKLGAAERAALRVYLEAPAQAVPPGHKPLNEETWAELLRMADPSRGCDQPTQTYL